MHQVKRTWSPYDRLTGGARAFVLRLWSRLGFSKEFGTMLRAELDLLMLRIWCAVNPSYHRKVRELATRRGLRVHLGCGNDLKQGWINVDCYPPTAESDEEILVFDVRRALPFADQSVATIYSEHFFEHLPFEVVRRTILPECFRVLEAGGSIRVGVPDGEYFVRGYTDLEAGQADPEYESHLRDRTPMVFLNEMARGSSHYYLYDYATLERIFRDAGFGDLRRGRAGDSPNPEFSDLDMREAWRAATTVYVEGRRPAP